MFAYVESEKPTLKKNKKTPMKNEPREVLEEYLSQAEDRWHRLLKESKERRFRKPDVPSGKTKQQTYTRVTEEKDWEELEEDLKQAEKRWMQSLQESDTKKQKPEVLLWGPRPKTLSKRKAKEEEIKFEIFPLPKPQRLRGDFINQRKLDLTLLNHELTYETNEDRIQAIRAKITSIKKEINNHRTQKKKKKQKQQ